MQARSLVVEELTDPKWRALFVACLITLGSYFIYDFPSSIGTGPTATIQALFVANGKTYDQRMNLALYTIYSWPNAILAIVGGLLIDRYLGLRRALILFCTLVFTGSGLSCIGVVSTSYPVIVLGRLLYGFGAESLSVAQGSYATRWSRGKRGFSVAFALSVVFSRIGSSLNFGLSASVAERHGVGVATFLGFCLCGFSLFACFGAVFLDRYGERKGYVAREDTALDAAATHGSGGGFHFVAQLRAVPLPIWILGGITLFVYSAIFPFIGFVKNFFQVKYGEDSITAGESISLYEGLSAGLLPLAGLLVDLLGRNVLVLIATHIWLCALHVMFLSLQVPSVAMMAIMTPCYTLVVASLWTMVPLIVDEHRTGFSYGVMTSVQNFGLAIFPLMTGAILDHYTPTTEGASSSASASGSQHAQLPTLEGYHFALMVVLGSALTGLLLSIILCVVDRRRGSGVLSASPAARLYLRRRLHESELPLAQHGGWCGESGGSDDAEGSGDSAAANVPRASDVEMTSPKQQLTAEM